jgi:hypothetical protein
MRSGMAKTFGSAALLACAMVLGGSAAIADERMPSTLDCPEGAEPQSVHGPAECLPTECSDDSGCKSGFTCVERALCVEARLGSKIATKACSGGGACTYPTYCETRKRCVKQSSAAKLRQTCGCSAPGAGADAALVAVCALAVATFLLRRRARP